MKYFFRGKRYRFETQGGYPHQLISLFVYRLVYSPVTRALDFEPQLSRVRLPEGEKSVYSFFSGGDVLLPLIATHAVDWLSFSPRSSVSVDKMKGSTPLHVCNKIEPMWTYVQRLGDHLPAEDELRVGQKDLRWPTSHTS